MFFLFIFFSVYNYAVFPIRVRNVDSTVFEILVDRFNEELSNYGKVLDREKARKILEELKNCLDDTCLLEISKKYEIENFVFIYLDRLGEKYFLRAKVFNSKKSKYQFNQEDIADSESDLPIIVKRITFSIVEDKPIEKVKTTETITKLESEEKPRKRLTRRYLGVRIGSIFPTTGFRDERNIIPKNLTRSILGFNYEVKNMGVGTEIAFFSRGFGIEFPLRYFLYPRDYTFFSEVLLGYYLMPDVYKESYFFDYGSKISGGNGPAFGIGGGFVLFHTFDVKFMLNIRYLFILNNGPDSGIEITFGLYTDR
ncbi:MAG: hypothetical protein ABDH37_01460 [Candidatus Hydrothermales bacterium]